MFGTTGKGNDSPLKSVLTWLIQRKVSITAIKFNSSVSELKGRGFKFHATGRQKSRAPTIACTNGFKKTSILSMFYLEIPAVLLSTHLNFQKTAQTLVWACSYVEQSNPTAVREPWATKPKKPLSGRPSFWLYQTNLATGPKSIQDGRIALLQERSLFIRNHLYRRHGRKSNIRQRRKLLSHSGRYPIFTSIYRACGLLLSLIPKLFSSSLIHTDSWPSLRLQWPKKEHCFGGPQLQHCISS